jgi:hypothetical protein
LTLLHLLLALLEKSLNFGLELPLAGLDVLVLRPYSLDLTVFLEDCVSLDVIDLPNFIALCLHACHYVLVELYLLT